MPIKEIDFHFRLPLTTILSLIASGHANLDIGVYGNEKITTNKLLNGNAAPKLLEGPKAALPKPQGKPRGKVSAITHMMKAMATRPTHTMQLADLRPLMLDLGLAEGSANSQVYIMRKRGLVRKTGEGTYQLTAQGLRECVKLGIELHAAPKGKKPPVKVVKKKKKPAAVKPPPADEPPATEPANETEQHDG